MGYEAVRAHSRRGKIGGSYVRSSLRFTDRPAPRRGHYPSVRRYSARGASVMPILWALAGLFCAVVLLLVVLTITHMGPADGADETDMLPARIAPAEPVAPPSPCFPFDVTC